MKSFCIFIMTLCLGASASAATSSHQDLDDWDTEFEMDRSQMQPLRFILGASAIQAEHLFLQAGSQRRVYRVHSTLTAGYFFLPEFALNALLSGRPNSIGFGAEAELVPVSIRGFRTDDFFQGAVLVGFYSTGDLKMRREAAHGGIRLSLNFSKHFGWTNSARFNFSARNEYAFSMFESGIALRL